jgi:hypothetical protein
MRFIFFGETSIHDGFRTNLSSTRTECWVNSWTRSQSVTLLRCPSFATTIPLPVPARPTPSTDVSAKVCSRFRWNTPSPIAHRTTYLMHTSNADKCMGKNVANAFVDYYEQHGTES